jgi:hypothetical protein
MRVRSGADGGPDPLSSGNNIIGVAERVRFGPVAWLTDHLIVYEYGIATSWLPDRNCSESTKSST